MAGEDVDWDVLLGNSEVLVRGSDLLCFEGILYAEMQKCREQESISANAIFSDSKVDEFFTIGLTTHHHFVLKNRICEYTAIVDRCESSINSTLSNGSTDAWVSPSNIISINTM